MLRNQFLYHWREIRHLPRHGKHFLLLRHEVVLNFQREVLLDFRLPRLQLPRRAPAARG